MEKFVVLFGFLVMCFFFMLGFVIGNEWLFGAVIGLVIILFGWFFWED